MRLLTALTDMIHTTVADLGPAGVVAAEGTLIELTKAVAKGRYDDVEPRLAPALTQAAKDLANRRLADPELSPAMLARELNVSVRTLHRAFAAVGEQVTTYIRHRRLHEARLALAAPSGRLSISEPPHTGSSRTAVTSPEPSRSTTVALPPSTPARPERPRPRRTGPRRDGSRPKARAPASTGDPLPNLLREGRSPSGESTWRSRRSRDASVSTRPGDSSSAGGTPPTPLLTRQNRGIRRRWRGAGP